MAIDERRPAPHGSQKTKGNVPMSKRAAKFALMMIFFGFVLMFASIPVHAQGEAGVDAGRPAEASYFLTTDGARKLGGSIGAGLVIMGGAAGVARVGSAAVESMARQPEVAGQISTAMIITAAMIEGATLFAVVVTLLAVLG
jgi:F-type H+-transporting ATPase subunit c